MPLAEERRTLIYRPPTSASPLSPDEALYQKVAKKVLVESLRIEKGETLTIETWNNGLPFARRLLVEARRLGAIPVMILEDEWAYVEGVRVAPKDVLGKMGGHEHGLLAPRPVFAGSHAEMLGIPGSKRLWILCAKEEATDAGHAHRRLRIRKTGRDADIRA